ncbi:MAG: HYR domain-containing protein [Saprospiraceae bacterium]|nr:HYR domain-containing protein [Saprospiraceae bacterium]
MLGDCGATVQWNAFTVSDNCPGVNVTQIGGPAIGTFVSVGLSTVTYRATDLAGNTSTCSFTVTVVDDEAPTITCPTGSPFSRFTDDPLCAYTTVGTEFDPTAMDNCPLTVVVSNDFNGMATLAGANIPQGSTTIIWTVTSGLLSATCSITIDVADDDPPTFTCPGPQTAFTNGSVNCEANVPNLAALVADEADNCGTAIVTQSTAAGTAITVTDGQLINYTITVTDGAGNTATCSVNVTYEDDDLPTFTCPTPQTVFTNGNVNCEANVP